MKRTLNSIIWIVLIIGLAFTLAFVESAQTDITCASLDVEVDDENGNYFVESQDIRELIFNTGDSVIGNQLSNINTAHLEKIINNDPSIRKAEVFKSIDGRVKVKAHQRKPLLRIFNRNNLSFYIDEEGFFMPLSSKYTARVLVANGHIKAGNAVFKNANIKLLIENDSLAEMTVLDELFLLAKFIEAEEWRKAQFQQIYVDENGEFELIPRVGNHRILIGDVSNLDEKIKKLMIFYNKGLSKTGWNEYKTINLKFKNQVVCTKN
jgi:cell division protein FtsQ